MKCAIMQPYFFPYIGYWQLIASVDCFVIFDNVNYIKRGWINRNRLLICGKPQYFRIPIKDASQNKLIMDTYIDESDGETINKNLKAVRLNYSRAPEYETVFPVIERILNSGYSNIADFNTYLIKEVCKYLCIDTKIIRASEIIVDENLKASQRILAIVKELGADTYINAIDGRELYSHELFEANNINLFFLQTGDIRYKQLSDSFFANLSIIDVMMNVPVEQLKEFLNEYELVK